MMRTEQEIEEMSQRRVRTALWTVIGFVIVLGAIAGNDMAVRAGMAGSPQRVAILVVMIGGGVLLIANMLRFVGIIRRSLAEPVVRQRLWDELASSNHVRSMMFAYLGMLLVLVVLAVISMFTTLSAPWVVNGVMLTGLGIQAVCFALLERRGQHAGE